MSMQVTLKQASDAASSGEEPRAVIDQITKGVANLNNIVDKVPIEVTRFTY